MRKSNLFSFRIMSIFILALLLSVISAEWCSAQNTTKINWVEGYVSATARGFQKKTVRPVDIDNAVTAAKIVAQAELLEAIKGVRIDHQTAVSDLLEEKTETSTRVQGILHNAFMAGEPQVKEEGSFVVAAVEMRVCLHNNSVECKNLQALTSVLPKSPDTVRPKQASCDLLPDLTSTREILPRLTYDTTQPLHLIIINLGGKPFQSASKDFAIGFESGKGQSCLIYSPEKVDPAVRRDRGTAEIFLNVADAEKKYGPNVITVAARSIDSNNHVIIDRKDAYLINLINDQAKNDIFRNAKMGIAVR